MCEHFDGGSIDDRADDLDEGCRQVRILAITHEHLTEQTEVSEHTRVSLTDTSPPSGA